MNLEKYTLLEIMNKKGLSTKSYRSLVRDIERNERNKLIRKHIGGGNDIQKEKN